jgi:uncharacterized 2Fe-2S/4Fe-4S cluster protein (DUF4445 family)
VHGSRPEPAAGRASGLTRTLFDDALERGLRVPTSCRSTGRCRECVVEIHEGAEYLAPPTAVEGFLRGPYRLACQAVVADPGAEVSFSVLRRRLRIVAPEAGLEPGPIDPVVQLADGVVRYGDEPIEPRRGGIYGVALDLGTTTVVLELVDLLDGRTLEVVAFENPQRFGGSDVINRISYDEADSGSELRHAIRRALNRELGDLYARQGIDRREVYEIVVVGNATMRDLFFGFDVSPIGQRPYKSITELEVLDGRRESTVLTYLAHELGVRANPKARVWGGPLIASHVGADVAADMVAIGLDGTGPGVRMLVDVGTNTEVVIAAHGRILVASCPAGPAFEGGSVTYGMQAAEGAIESVALGSDGEFAIRTIGDAPPVGLCGSGLIDLLAVLGRSGRMSPKGVFAPRAPSIEVHPVAGITFSRADGSALAQAKAANTVGQWILLRELGIDPAEVDRLYLAGGFASYVDARNAIDIGFLAPVPVDRIEKVGNASLQGAKRLLLSASARRHLAALIPKIEHIELETTPDFFELFVDACQFKPLPDRLAGSRSRVAS